MTPMKNPTDLLKEYFYKSLLIQLSTKAIDYNWGEDLKTHISNHVFTDPFEIEEQTDEEQVQHFNQLMGTSWTTIKWRIVKSSGSQLHINDQNKDKFVPDAISQLYLQLSIPIFENLIVLLKSLLFNCKSWNSFDVIGDFYTEFKSELEDSDKKNVSYKYSTILLLHNLRLFRNCITHADGEVSYLEQKFDKYNECVDQNKKGYEDLKDLGHLSKNLFCYKFSKDNTKIFLDTNAFKNLIDLYSQIAYVAYMCFCEKRGLTAVI